MSLRGPLSIAALVTLAAWACSATDETSAPTTSLATSSGAVGGMGGAGGAGGASGGAGGGPIPCPLDCGAVETDVCHQSVCDTSIGECEVIDADGEPCDDGLFCTVDDSCSGGVCGSTTVNDCGLAPEACEQVLCDELGAACTVEPKSEGASCQLDDLCITGGTCQSDVCVGDYNDCFLEPVPNECYVALCNPSTGMCETAPGNEGQPCIDPNDLCRVGASCAGGVCYGGAPKDCSQLDFKCDVGSCNPNSGLCTTTTLADGSGCNDLDGCTSGTTCSSGMCGAGSSITQCIHNDSCCPSGCTEQNDDDCKLDILLLGDDVPPQRWNDYRAALTAAAQTWTEHDLVQSPTFPSAIALSSYDTIILFDHNAVSWGSAEAQRIADWLTAGGHNLFASGVDLLYKLGSASPNTGEAHLLGLLKVAYAGDHASISIATLDGAMGDPIGDDFASPNGLILSQSTGSDGDFANANVGPAVHAAHYGGGGNGSGQSGLSHYDPGGYRVVWLGVNFHDGLTSQSQRDQLMSNIVSFFKN